MEGDAIGQSRHTTPGFVHFLENYGYGKLVMDCKLKIPISRSFLDSLLMGLGSF